MEKISIKNLSLWIGERKILDDVTWTLSEGETVAIIGESGAGKSLMTRLLVGDIPRDAKICGSVNLGDIDCLNISGKEWEKIRGTYISYIEQNPMGLFNELQNIKSHGVELFRSKGESNIKEIEEKLVQGFEIFNLKNPRDILKKYPHELSGGMLQRIMFSMMMQLKTDIILADEPTSALDQFNTDTVVDSLKRFKDAGFSLVIVTHDYSLVSQLADKVIIMKSGQIVESGSSNEVINNPKTLYAKTLMKPRINGRYDNEVNS